MDDLLAQITADADTNLGPIAKATSKRMMDRLYHFTVTHPDGSVDEHDASHVTVNRYRNWYRINKPGSIVVVEEYQTSVTSDGKTYKELTFEPKMYVEDRLPRNFTSTEDLRHPPKPKISDIEAKNKVARQRSEASAKANAKVREDRNLRIYANDTGALVFSGPAKQGVIFMQQNKVTAMTHTLYIPKYLQKKFYTAVSDIRMKRQEEAKAKRQEQADIKAMMKKEGK